MTDHDSFDALFAGVDGPVSPDPRFATCVLTVRLRHCVHMQNARQLLR